MLRVYAGSRRSDLEWRYNGEKLFNDIFGSVYGNGTQGLEITLRKKEYEERFDLMWSNYGKGIVTQLEEYYKQLNTIKSAGFKVFRNSEGKHKIVKGGE